MFGEMDTIYLSICLLVIFDNAYSFLLFSVFSKLVSQDSHYFRVS